MSPVMLGYEPVFAESDGLATFFLPLPSVVSLGRFLIAATYLYRLYAGGAFSVNRCSLSAGSGCMCVALSVAALHSVYPTCGGCTFRLLPSRAKELVPNTSIRRFLGSVIFVGVARICSHTRFAGLQSVWLYSSRTNPCLPPTSKEWLLVVSCVRDDRSK